MTKIEAHAHKEDLQADLRQDKVYNPFSEDSKKMIYELGNIESFELCEIDTRVQCSCCLSYWAQGVLYCTCGLCLNNTEEVRKLNQGRLDTLLISKWIIRKNLFMELNMEGQKSRLKITNHLTNEKDVKKG